MHSLKWHSKLGTGIDLLDSEHKQVLQLVDDCIELARRGATRDELIVRLNEIYRSVATHFENEGIFASNAGKPHSYNHKNQHENLLIHFKSEISKLEDIEQKKISVQNIIFNFYAWFISHIELEDKKHFSQAENGSAA